MFNVVDDLGGRNDFSPTVVEFYSVESSSVLFGYDSRENDTVFRLATVLSEATTLENEKVGFKAPPLQRFFEGVRAQARQANV